MKEEMSRLKTMASADRPTRAAPPLVMSAPVQSGWQPSLPVYPPFTSMPPPPLPTTGGFPANVGLPGNYGGSNASLNFAAPRAAPSTAPKYSAPAEGQGAKTNAERRCFGCRETGHFKRDCPNKAQGSKDANARPLKTGASQPRPVEEPVQSQSYLRVEIDGSSRAALLDSGCDLTVVPYHVVRDRALQRTRERLYGVDGKPIPIAGSVRFMMKVGPLELECAALVSKNDPRGDAGIDWMKAHDVHWHFGKGRIEIGDQQFALMAKGGVTVEAQQDTSPQARTVGGTTVGERQGWSIEELREATGRDPVLAVVRGWLERGERPPAEVAPRDPAGNHVILDRFPPPETGGRRRLSGVV